MKLEITALTKRFDRHVALDSLHLDSEVHVLCLIGPSGGGKSTLLRILGGLETPDSGSIQIDGTPIPSSREELLRYRRQNGFLFQSFNLFPHLSALQNLTLPLQKVHGLEAAESNAIAEKSLQRFGLLDHAHKLPTQLSGGQQQRVGIARAVSMKPKILFLDEPTSALDPEMTGEVLDLIRELAEEGQNIILSTHEMGFARAVADRIAFLAAGNIQECSTPSAFFSSPESPLAQRFLSRVMKY
ncbi:amino acid ABC transporter ATP-binding protein [Luteolibacter pohnpeiensis]|uniref:Amino acid ABC transporter ATP-binding protein n=1 Tax=Luteolibacter pohnpeiensis TaxID=454153 RepID=A0A934SEB1_9BACT|nr:amino acid ABC transporter ATP-binding protein [Luteolibacter pohnpeiensis]MBK1883623.1 amino acid ABC transporter ATP-binding protein [Luteolibacter pohnpeiensis]